MSSLAPCPPSSPLFHRKYSKRTQEEIDHKFIRDGLQKYYLEQSMKKEKPVSKKPSPSLKKADKGQGTATILAAANAGIIAVGPIPLELSRRNSNMGQAPPTPVPPVPSPVAQRKGKQSFSTIFFCFLDWPREEVNKVFLRFFCFIVWPRKKAKFFYDFFAIWNRPAKM